MSACPVGYFGQYCSEMCINSYASYTCSGCNDVNGSCDYECPPGWIGYFCQKSNNLIYTHIFFNFLFEKKNMLIIIHISFITNVKT